MSFTDKILWWLNKKNLNANIALLDITLPKEEFDKTYENKELSVCLRVNIPGSERKVFCGKLMEINIPGNEIKAK